MRPHIIRPSSDRPITLGGTGGGIAYNREEFAVQVRKGLDASPITEVLIDRSILGWKEYELEVVRDGVDNVIIICSIENIDPMGVHTGDSITVAPAQTLTDVEYQEMRDASIAIIREIGVEAGGCNVQFAVNPEDGEMVVIEMNPRVSRSSALASKATGFPIARVGAKLAVGYRLHELPNDITKTTPASFEPVARLRGVKIPRFAFEKFSEVDDTLGVQMKSVGEAMAIGRTFRSRLAEGLPRARDRPVRLGRPAMSLKTTDSRPRTSSRCSPPCAGRLRTGRSRSSGRSSGADDEEIFEAPKIDPWFLDQLLQIIECERRYAEAPEVTPELTRTG